MLWVLARVPLPGASWIVRTGDAGRCGPFWMFAMALCQLGASLLLLCLRVIRRLATGFCQGVIRARSARYSGLTTA